MEWEIANQGGSKGIIATPLLPAIFSQHNASGHKEGRVVGFTNVMISRASSRAQTSAFGEVGALKMNGSSLVKLTKVSQTSVTIDKLLMP